MTILSSTSATVYFDNCLVGAVVKGDHPAHLPALSALLRHHELGKICAAASTEVLGPTSSFASKWRMCSMDVAQTDGEPLPELGEMAGDPGAYTQRVMAFIASLGIALEYADDLDGADGISKKGQIVIRSGQTPATAFSVLVHELAHSLLHQGPIRPGTKTARELEAEAVAFTVCSGIGLETGSVSADYIGLYNGDADLLTQSLDAIQRTASQILQAISPG